MPLISSLFGRSPIRPMQQHMKAAVTCAREVLPLVEAMAAGDTAAIGERRAEIDRLEHEADEIKNICLLESPASACSSLVALARERGAPDNVTVQVARVRRG